MNALLFFALMAQVQPPVGSPPVPGIRAGCTADSMSVAMAGSLTAQELGRWTCYAQNTSTQTLTLSRAGFALDFMELRQLDIPDVTDVFTQKQKMTKSAKAARVAELAGFGALLVMGQAYVHIGVKAALATGLLTYGSTKAVDYFSKQVPPTTNALSGLLTADVQMAPGQSVQWKVYASKLKGASSLGPRILTH